MILAIAGSPLSPWACSCDSSFFFVSGYLDRFRAERSFDSSFERPAEILLLALPTLDRVR